MRETTLNALIKLFALFSSISELKREKAIQIFSFHLQLHLGIAASDDYLKLFEKLLDLYVVEGVADFPIDMNQQARDISENIKNQLPKDEQLTVFLRFLELTKSGDHQKALSLFSTVANVFNIDQNEYNKFTDFIFHTDPGQLVSPDFLIIDRHEDSFCKSIKHCFEKNIDGHLVFMYSPLINHFLFVFHGKEELTLEGNPILPDHFYAFSEGSIIRGPRISPIYYVDISSLFNQHIASNPFVFTGNEIDFRFKNSDNGLHSFSFSERSGQLVAIMGGSGVGKSTLINILNGNIPAQTGTIKINQFDIYNDKKEVEGLIGNVPQNDLLFEELTVWENLYYNACLCFDNLSKNEIELKVELILKELELTPLKNLKVGSTLNKIISGGQRKRLNVAMELIREPAILFADEPTSGLSSIDSEMVMLLLKQQARKGKLFIVNIHQPSSAIFKLFDKLWIMDKGGRPIYTGNPLDAFSYFKNEVQHLTADECECDTSGNVNPEQVLEIIETKMIDSSGRFTSQRRFSPEHWYKLYQDHKLKEKKPAAALPTHLPDKATDKPGLLKQFVIYFKRNFRIKVSDRQYLLVNLLEAPVLAVIVAYFTRFSEGNQYLFFENKSLISYLFMSIVVVLFMGMSVSAEEIIKDRSILQREKFLNLSRFSYLNSKFIFLLLLSAFQAFSFVYIGNMILEIHHMNFSFWLVLFSVAVFSNLLGLNISAGFNSVVTIYIIIPLLLIPQILLCGVIVKFDDLQSKTADKDAVPFVGEMMVSRWAFEAMTVTQFKNNQYMVHFFDMEKQMNEARFRSELLTTELTGQTDLVTGWLKNGGDDVQIAAKLNLIANELSKLDSETPMANFELTSHLKPGQFNNEIAEQVKAHLEDIKIYFSSSFQTARKAKDRQINSITKTMGNDYLYKHKLKYHNKSLEALMLNVDTREYFRETANGIMQKAAPIYKEPDFNYGRAHFLAPHKIIFGKKIDTLFFNVLVIWMFSLFLYLALYFDWLRKIINIKWVNKD